MLLWIKRNLFLAVTGLSAALLLGGGIYFVMTGRTRNAALDEDVGQTRAQLDGYYNKDPFPHATNIATAKKEVSKLRGEVQKLTKYFLSVPVDRMDTREFLAMRDRTLKELRDGALRASVGLPEVTPPYAFSFVVQRGKGGAFGADTFPTVPEQMVEVKALCAALYDARVSRILNIRRARASQDDHAPNAPMQDYTAGVGIVSNANAQAISHPYEVTFTCFSAELGEVLSSLIKSPHGFVVKAVQIEPETMQVADSGGPVMAAAEPTPFAQPAPTRFPRQPRPLPPTQGAPPRIAPATPTIPRPNAANDRPIVLLKERRLKVSMLVYAIRPAK